MLRLNPDKISNLPWSLADSYHTTNIGIAISSTLTVSTNYIDVKTLSYAKEDRSKEWCGVSLSTDVNTLQSNMRPIVCNTVGCTRDNHEKNMIGSQITLCLINGYVL